MGSDLLKLFRFFFETALFIGFFHGIKPIIKPGTIKKITAFLAFCLLFSLYFYDFLFPNILLRFFLRFFIFVFYLKLLKGIKWQKAAYFSGISCSAYYALQNIFITPLLYPFFIHDFILVYIAFLLLFTFLYMNIPFDKIRHIGADRIILLVSVISCVLYVKYSLSIMIEGTPLTNIEMTLFPIFLQLFLIASIVIYEKYLYVRMSQEEAHIQEVVTDLKLKNLKNQLSAEDDLRILTHDMKNHFIAIKKIAENSNTTKINDYINGLLKSIDTSNKYIETGNELLDGFLSQKMAEAEKSDIEFSIILDFRPAAFISDVDICTIFGNAIDNSIEACMKIDNPSDRYISIHSSYIAGQVVITFTNSYSGSISKVNDFPVTTKKSSAIHGFGLPSINKAIQKYDGVISINLDAKNKFILTVMIPIPE